MSIILNLIEEKNNQLLGFDGKKKERDSLREKIAILDKEINDFDETKILADIDELTDCAVKLGLLPSETEAEAENTEDESVESQYVGL